MNIQKSAKELRQQNEYLVSLKKEDITFIIKSCIYELESHKYFNEEDLNKLNKVILSNEPYNNLYFKYNKERLNTKGVIFLEENNDLTFIISVFYYFKNRIPLIIVLSSEKQIKFFDIFKNLLKDNEISDNFIIKIDE
tara:strand:+ start:2381 stop:2794 length:414 start_codon:yes stop_codon:yes gene_type:complete